MESEGVSQDVTGVITGGDTTVSPPVPQSDTEPVQVEVPEQVVPEIVVPEAVIVPDQVVGESAEAASQTGTGPETAQEAPTTPDLSQVTSLENAVTSSDSTTTPQSESQTVQTVEQPIQQPTEPIVNSPTNKNFVTELLLKARSKIQLKKRLKLEKIMGLFGKKNKITNDEIEKLLHVSDSTATRYLDELEKENKISQNGKTGKGVVYTKN